MSKLIGIKAIVTMSRTLYVEVPDEATEEEIQDRASKEIMLPHNALYMAGSMLQRAGIKIDKLDLKDWEVDKYEFRELGTDLERCNVQENS